MARKPYQPDIEYIEKYYSYGSEARIVEIKPQRKQPKTQLPKPKKEQITKIYVDPVALCGLVMALIMIVVMAVGIVQFRGACKEYQTVKAALTQLQDKNMELNHTYHTSYDLEEIEVTARALGMIPKEEAKTVSIQVQIPQPEAEPTWWENVRWFLSGLFA